MLETQLPQGRQTLFSNTRCAAAMDSTATDFFATGAFAKARFTTFAVACLALVLLVPQDAAGQNGVGQAAITPPGPPGAEQTPTDFADLAERLSSAVVNISTSQTLRRDNNRERRPIPNLPEDSPLQDFFDDFMDRGDREPRRVTALGSGFIIDLEGHVVTNNHVIEDADEIEIILNDGITTLPAELIGTDEQTDLALLKVESNGELPVVDFGDSDVARVGNWVLAIGNPFGLNSSVTAGIISARNRDIQSGVYDEFIQTDASINQGNSGGPLFNMIGEVIGVNSAIYSPTGGSVGIGFAIPSNVARNVINQLRESGRVSRGMIGVRIQTVEEDIAASLNLDDVRGALVSGVNEDGPAEDAGIQEGDVIISFNGREVADDRALPRIVAETPAGTTVDVEVIRRGQRRTLQVLVAPLPDDALANDDDDGAPERPNEDAENSSRLGVTLEPLNGDSRNRYRIENNVNGVLVAEVDIDGPSRDKLRPGDVILEVAQAEVLTAEEVEDRIDGEIQAGRSAVLLQVHRRGNDQYIGVRVVEP
jgi:serine protease Do